MSDPPSSNGDRWARWLSGLAYAAYTFVVSWALFGPTGGFHWMFRFGLLGYLVLDLEDGPMQVRISWLLSAISVAVWMAALAIGWLPVRALRRRQAREQLLHLP